MTIQAILANYLNGNLTDAKQGAKRHSWRKLYLALRDDCQVAARSKDPMGKEM